MCASLVSIKLILYSLPKLPPKFLYSLPKLLPKFCCKGCQGQSLKLLMTFLDILSETFVPSEASIPTRWEHAASGILNLIVFQALQKGSAFQTPSNLRLISVYIMSFPIHFMRLPHFFTYNKLISIKFVIVDHCGGFFFEMTLNMSYTLNSSKSALSPNTAHS